MSAVNSSPASHWLLAPVFISTFNFIEEFIRFYLHRASKPIFADLNITSCAIGTSLTTNASMVVYCAQIANDTQCNETPNCTWASTDNEFLMLTNTVFIPIMTSSTILWGIAIDYAVATGCQRGSILLLISACMIMTLGTAISPVCTNFAQFLSARVLFAIGYAGVDPICAKEIFSCTKPAQRGKAMAIYQWAMYIGFGVAFGYGGDLNWKTTHYICAGVIPLSLCGYYIFRNNTRQPAIDVKYTKGDTDTSTISCNNICSILLELCQPKMLTLLLAFITRTVAALTFATYSTQFFMKERGLMNFGKYVMGASIFGGILGITLGGVATDVVLQRKYFENNPKCRLIVQACSQILAGPAALGALYLPSPLCFVSLIIAFVFAEMWYGVLFAILFEVVPQRYNTTFFTIFLFIGINVAGQLFNVLKEIPTLTIMTCFYAGGYTLSGFIFLVTFFLF